VDQNLIGYSSRLGQLPKPVSYTHLDVYKRQVFVRPIVTLKTGGETTGMTAIDFTSFVDQLASVSGETILPFFRTSLEIDNKKPGGFDPVTAADRAAEAKMREFIRNAFPEHGIVGEEYGAEQSSSEYVWVLDPIDGTKSFIAGMVAWGTLIGLMRLGEPVYGMMHQPFTRERFSGDGAAARYRGPTGNRDLHVRACANLSDALLFTTSPLLMLSLIHISTSLPVRPP